MHPTARESPKFEAPPCPCCGLDMDQWGLTFAKSLTMKGREYYCNNPLCSGDYVHKTD